MIILLSLVMILVSACQKKDSAIIKLEKEVEKTYEKTGKVLAIMDQASDKTIKISSDGEVLDYKADYIQNLEEIDTDDMVDFVYDQELYILQIKILADESEEVAQDKQDHKDQVMEEAPPIIIQGQDDFDQDGLEIYDFFDLSMYDTGLDMIILYTDANTDQDGDLLFDDGNRFVLTAQRGPEIFVLYDQRVQMASFDINTFTENDQLRISFLDKGTAHVHYSIFKFDGENFTEETLYQSSGNVNLLGNISL